MIEQKKNDLALGIIFAIALVIMMIFAEVTFGQGDTDSPYSTNGWDEPIEFTDHYYLPIYRLLSNPGGHINWSQRKIDSLLFALVVYTDSQQIFIRNDTLFHANNSSGIDTFTTTLSRDTVTVAGLDSMDVVIVTARYDSTGTVLAVKVETGRFIVIRSSTAISGQSYNWIWRKRYQW